MIGAAFSLELFLVIHSLAPCVATLRRGALGWRLPFSFLESFAGLSSEAVGLVCASRRR